MPVQTPLRVSGAYFLAWFFDAFISQRIVKQNKKWNRFTTNGMINWFVIIATDVCTIDKQMSIALFFFWFFQRKINFIIIHPASASSDEKIYRCIVEFSGHCFTKSPNQRKGETLASYESELHYSLATETRIFCFERHRYSLQLPQIIKELANRKCFFTSADDKFLTIEVQNEEGKTNILTIKRDKMW